MANNCKRYSVIKSRDCYHNFRFSTGEPGHGVAGMTKLPLPLSPNYISKKKIKIVQYSVCCEYVTYDYKL